MALWFSWLSGNSRGFSPGTLPRRQWRSKRVAGKQCKYLLAIWQIASTYLQKKELPDNSAFALVIEDGRAHTTERRAYAQYESAARETDELGLVPYR